MFVFLILIIYFRFLSKLCILYNLWYLLCWTFLNYLLGLWTGLFIRCCLLFWIFRCCFSCHSIIAHSLRFIPTIFWNIFLLIFIYILQFFNFKWNFTIVSNPSFITSSITSRLSFSTFSMSTQTLYWFVRFFRSLSNIFDFFFKLIIFCHNISILLHRRFFSNYSIFKSFLYWITFLFNYLFCIWLFKDINR